MAVLFDTELRALRRDRAALSGPELFLHQRAFEDCLERVALHQRTFSRALLIGCPDPAWPRQLSSVAAQTDVVDPGTLFAQQSGGAVIVEDSWEPPQGIFDLVLALGTLDTVNDLPRALLSIRWAMMDDALFIGAVSGGETLPLLRSAMRAADKVAETASAHVHPRIEPSALPHLLQASGFDRPVVDIDRVAVGYPSLGRLVHDLRRMAATNVLMERSKAAIGRKALAAASAEFESRREDGRCIETFEILHFAAWTPREAAHG